LYQYHNQELFVNIYFSCSITGGRNEQAIYQKIVEKLISAGYEVPTAHLSSPDILDQEKVAQPQEIFLRDMNWLLHSDLVVAEVTTPSHGVGYEIAVALGQQKPVLCLAQTGRKVSMILSGNTSPLLTLHAYENEEQIESILLTWLRRFPSV
jgi:nucleoside 2-deoxyribosyltransferase